MPIPASTREQRLRNTKAQLIDEIETLEQSADTSGAPPRGQPSDGYLADRELADLAKFPSENPNPVLRVMPDGTMLYANEAAIAVKGLLKGRKKPALARDLANVIAEASRTAGIQETEFESGDRIFAFSATAVAGETYINIYGRDISREHAAKRELAEKEAQFRIALDSMPGLLVYTDEDLNVVLCNERFNEMYRAQREMLQPGQPYTSFLRCLAEQGYYGDGDVEALVAERTESLRNPSDKTFQETTPDGRVHSVRRQRAVTGGTVTVVTDITKQKRAEKELSEKEAQLRLALDNMPGGMMLSDRDMNTVFFNAQYSELCGFPDGLVKTGGSFHDELRFQADRGDFGPGDKDELIEEVAAIYRRGEAVSFERTIAGSGRTVQIYLGPTPEGGCVTIITDITERKQAERGQAEKETQLRIALDNMPGGMEFVDRDRNYVFFNPQYSELHDYPDGLLKIGGPVLDETRYQAERGDFGPGDPDKLIEEALVPFSSGKPESYERTLPSGRALHFNIAPTPDGGYVTIATNITELKRREQELAEKEAQLRVAMENMPGGIRMVDGNRNFVLSNQQYLDLYDLPEGLLKAGESIRVENLYCAQRGDFGPGDPETLVDDWLAEAPERMELAGWEWTLEGGKVLQVHTSPLPDRGVVNVVTDITERKRAEAELARKEAQLRVALDNMPGGMTLEDRDGNYVLFNSQYVELHDYPEGFLKVGMSTREEVRFQAERGDFGPGDKDELVDQVLDLYHGENTTSWERTLHDGRTLRFNLAPTPESGYVSIVTDITERKRAEQELAESQERLQALADYMQVALSSMSDGIYILDGDQNIFAFNQRYVDLLNFPEGLVREGGSIVDVIEFAAKRGDYGSQFEGDIDDVVAGRLNQIKSNERYFTEHTTPAGRIVEFRGSAIQGGGFVTIMHDITERKQAEEALLAAKQRSEEASELVAEKNRLLESLSTKLSKYLSPQVYASIFSGEQSVEIASKRKKLTVFFSDIADFAGTTDSLESEELTNLLNHYLTEMSKIALDFGATIDKYVGDSIVAFFGDPETRGVKEDARACVNMAIAMQRRMRELRSEWLDMGLEKPFEVRIGINTGFCTVGNFGSAERMDYTIIGNEVNLAARLESLSEVGGILMAHETHALVKDTVLAEEGDTLTVKGFAKPVRTYSIVGLYDDLAEQGRIIRKEQAGVRVMVDLKKGDKAAAIQAIEDVLSQLRE